LVVVVALILVLWQTVVKVRTQFFLRLPQQVVDLELLMDQETPAEVEDRVGAVGPLMVVLQVLVELEIVHQHPQVKAIMVVQEMLLVVELLIMLLVEAAAPLLLVVVEQDLPEMVLVEMVEMELLHLFQEHM
jgi:hypothetical protein